MQKLTNEQLISAYLDAVKHELDNTFIRLLFNEIQHRDIQHLIKEKNYYKQMG